MVAINKRIKYSKMRGGQFYLLFWADLSRCLCAIEMIWDFNANAVNGNYVWRTRMELWHDFDISSLVIILWNSHL